MESSKGEREPSLRYSAQVTLHGYQIGKSGKSKGILVSYHEVHEGFGGLGYEGVLPRVEDMKESLTIKAAMQLLPKPKISGLSWQTSNMPEHGKTNERSGALEATTGEWRSS